MNASNIWIIFSLEDLKMADLAYNDKIYNQVCFHSQQAVEKAIKGYIEYKGKIPPKTHKITDLISLIKIENLGNIHDEIVVLDRFYIPTRYPDALPGSLTDGLPQKNDAKEALGIAEKVVEIIQKEIQKNMNNKSHGNNPRRK